MNPSKSNNLVSTPTCVKRRNTDIQSISVGSDTQLMDLKSKTPYQLNPKVYKYPLQSVKRHLELHQSDYNQEALLGGAIFLMREMVVPITNNCTTNPAEQEHGQYINCIQHMMRTSFASGSLPSRTTAIFRVSKLVKFWKAYAITSLDYFQSSQNDNEKSKTEANTQ